ncbi:MAG TPA: relaxase/mobilization nuclease domain-containing protein [Ligilactobacillus salivarius]|uniref:Relaxase/mobilization nuclease domain-containing protein n=1 Tax=Ligilactobacillus salivarius TaxID=1624 RepID=A0A921ICF8_9LACO|nr:relaxase/mobilization nuclease domain-containing protein [Ligilactobacillus salivarius]
MPATLTIKTSRSGAKAIAYSSARNNHDKAHNNYKMKRVLASGGVNCDPASGKAQMQAVWRKKQTKKKTMIEAYTIVQSFDPKNFDYRKQEDVQLVNQMGQELVKKIVPTRMALVYTQADGTHHVLHNHIVICSQDPITLKAMRGDETMFKTWAHANDRVLKSHGYEPLKEITGKYANAEEKLTRAEIAMAQPKKINGSNGRKVIKTPVVTRTEKIKERIEVILDDPSVNSWQKFQEKAKDYDLDVKIRYNKQKKINGLSYRLVDDDKMKRGIRAKRLGTRYMKDDIDDILRQNVEKLKQQQIKQAKARKLEADRKQREIEQQQQEVIRRAQLAERKTRQHLLPDGEDAGHTIRNQIIIESINRNRAKQQHSIPAEQHNERESELDHELSIFDDYTAKISRHLDKTHRSSAGNHDGSKGKSTIDELIEQLQQQQQLESIKRKQLNRQLAANAGFIAFSRKRANKLARWVDKYYRKSIRFVERHFSASSNLVRKLDISVKGTSDKLDESTIHHRNGNEQPRSTTKDNSIGSTSNQRHAKIDSYSELDPASRLSTNHQFNDQIDDDIPF